jgi:hypothetical protein
MKTVHVTVDPSKVRPSHAIAVTVGGSTALLMVTSAMFGGLTVELGSDDAALAYLLDMATQVDRPLGVNGSIEDGSQTAFIAPITWTQERLAVWVGGRHEELIKLFGPSVLGALEDTCQT